MKILADKYLYKLDELMPGQITLHRYDPDTGFPKNAVEYDALLIRTVTKINPETLPKAGNLTFIGSATAGFDHVDTEHLRNMGIAFARSEGGNAGAVGEYVITVLHKWAKERKADLKKKKIGVIGCGNTGGKTAWFLTNSGIEPVLYDPPKAEKNPGFISASLSKLLSCDILTFHTPLTFSGKYPAFHMCGKKWLSHGFDLIINTARGGVVDEQALLNAHKSGAVQDFILDVWEKEPLFSDKAAKKAFIATPHIAGYSKQAKWRASSLVIEKMCRFFGLAPGDYQEDMEVHFTNPVSDMAFSDFLWEHSNISQYDKNLRKLIGLKDMEKGYQFAKLRSETELRTEFAEIKKQYKKLPGQLEALKIFG